MGGMWTPQGRKGPPGSGLGGFIVAMLFAFVVLLIIQHALGGPIP